MKTNDLKKGDVIRLRNGWEATIQDNRKGNTRLAEVRGDFTELGSVYSHDILEVRIGVFGGASSTWETLEHTKSQDKLRALVNGAFSTIRLLS